MELSDLNPQRPIYPMTPDAAQNLTQAILARTSGSPCQRLQSLACAFVDGELDEGQNGLVQSHLEHCADCSALVAALATCQATLPKLVEANPGPWFTQRVLRATVHQPSPSFDLSRAIKRLMHRPRIALEAAYLGAAAGLMGIYLPIPTPTVALRVPSLVQPMSASAHRVMDQMMQVERRTTTSLQQGLIPMETLQKTPSTAKRLWLRLTARMKATWQVFRKPQPVPPSAEEKHPPSANR
jgi:hypothetical protein